MLRVPYEELHEALRRNLLQAGFTPDRAARCARLFAESSRDGVYSHGLNRFPRFMEMIRQGIIDIHAKPVCTARFGAVERWDGGLGPGNLNAHAAMNRAIEVAREHGVGCVALARTNHWMRGGSYGWQAAEAGAIGICWTNTMPNLPPWGARESRLGNNPLIIAAPRPAGPVVLDMAMSQFSYGSLASYRKQGRLLPADGGFDAEGRLTRDPGAIEASGRPLPIGLWKGSGLAMMLDLLASLLSGGLATHQITPDPLREAGLSQVFLAFDIAPLHDAAAERLTDEVIAFVQGADPVQAGTPPRYPGEQTLATRRENLAHGVPVDPEIWREISGNAQQVE